MKLSKITLAFLLLGILIIVCAVLGLNYRNQVAEQAGLEAQVRSTNQKIAAVPLKELQLQETDLKVQQKRLETQISEIKESFVQPVNTINITHSLFTLASDNNVELQRIDSSPTTNQDLSNIRFSALPLTIHLKGSVSNIVEFVHGLTTEYNLSFVKPVQIDVPSSTPDITIKRIWELKAGSLPAGLKLDPLTGTISGIPDDVGTSTFTVKVDFSDSTSATKDFAITVGPHEISGSTLGKGEVNVPYSQNLDASGVVPESSENEIQDALPTAIITMNILSGEVN